MGRATGRRGPPGGTAQLLRGAAQVRGPGGPARPRPARPHRLRAPGLPQEDVPAELQHERHHHGEHHLAHQLVAPFHREVGAHPRTGELGHGHGQRHLPQHHAPRGEERHGGDVGGEVDHLRIRGGAQQPMPQQAGKGHDEEGARAWTEETVIEAHAESHERAQGPQPRQGRLRPVAGGRALAEGEEDRHGHEQHEHQGLEHLGLQPQHQLRPRQRAQQTERKRHHRQVSLHQPCPGEAQQRRARAKHGLALVGPQRHVRRHAGGQQGRQREQPASPRDGIHAPGTQGHEAQQGNVEASHVHAGSTSAWAAPPLARLPGRRWTCAQPVPERQSWPAPAEVFRALFARSADAHPAGPRARLRSPHLPRHRQPCGVRLRLQVGWTDRPMRPDPSGALPAGGRPGDVFRPAGLRGPGVRKRASRARVQDPGGGIGLWLQLRHLLRQGEVRSDPRGGLPGPRRRGGVL
ncbi:hypothetical protein STIAU_2390 [Stigmatella aurantiaca DW4/3-1]|uniref:Uncharacterized protein n=1 Tax=Stigmatella aurantiaca (strain DW4/3-1) TaxID=378806 RepID=Q08MM6_STIAD|nr:hypothetical protein STIAU_2390 [Stigmatella aurantiaca DW4/3-1]